VNNSQPDILTACPNASGGWRILCSPGPLAQLLNSMAGQPGPLQVTIEEGQPVAVITYTTDLDHQLKTLIDQLITLRHQAGQVQLQLFAPEWEQGS
jgi:hypothetical protein